MKTVFKYATCPNDRIYISLPTGAQPLRFDFQDGSLCLWALVDPNAGGFQSFVFRMAGTGHNIEEEVSDYINTVYANGLVFHFFRLK